jgi:ABC-type sugar transport system ATPase subunit
MAGIEIQNVVKRYGKVTAVHGIDLTVADGEFVVLVGPLGLRQVHDLAHDRGLEEITGGTIRIGGRIVNQLEPKDRNIAMVFQNYAIYPHMSVAKNIAFGLYTSGLSEADKRRRVEEVGKILGLEKLLDRRPPNSPAASASGSPSAAPWCATPRPSCSTSPCRTSTRSCAPRCGSRSSACTSSSAPPSSS